MQRVEPIRTVAPVAHGNACVTPPEARQVRRHVEAGTDSIHHMRTLPDELLTDICERLNTQELKSLRGVDTGFRKIANEFVASAQLMDPSHLGAVLKAFPHLEELRLSIKSANLESAAVPQSVVRALDADAAGKGSNLHMLRVSGRTSRCAIRASDLGFLGHFPNLKALHLKKVVLSKLALLELRWTPNVRELHLKNVELGESGLEFLQHTPSLRHLTCEDTVVPENGLEPVKYVPDLHSLTLANTDLHSEDLVHLAPLQKLEYLDLDRNENIDDDALEAIGELRKLDTLSVAYTLIDGGGFTDLKNIELRHLIWNTTAQGMNEETLTTELAQLKSLEELSLGSGNLEYEHADRVGLAPLRHLPKLRSLDIGSLDNVKDSDLAHLAEMKGLEEVHLSNSIGFTRAGLEALFANRSLREVHIGDTEYASLAAELQARYPHCKITDGQDRPIRDA